MISAIVSTSTETVKLRTEENIFFQTTTGQGTETSRKTTTTEETSHVVVDIHLIPEQYEFLFFFFENTWGVC
jgi:hypothetical protein